MKYMLYLLSYRFESARSMVGSLPSEAPSPRPTSHLSIRSFSTIGDSRPGTAGESRPGTAGESRPSSRCSRYVYCGFKKLKDCDQS